MPKCEKGRLVYDFQAFFAHSLTGNSVMCQTDLRKTECSDGFDLNYTLPMFDLCRKRPDSDGNMVQTIPKLIPPSPQEAATCLHQRKSKLGIPPGRRVCRFPGECPTAVTHSTI